MPVYLIPGKIVVFLKVLPFVAVFFVLPGFFLRKILGRFSKAIDGSIALDFSLGYSIFFIPGLITLYAMLSWAWLLAIWFAVLAVITAVWFIFCFNKDDLKLPRFKGLPGFSWQTMFIILAGTLLVFTFVVLFLKGGYFIGDQQHHLAYIVKHLNTDIITPYVPMYKGTTEIPYNYAYEINYLVIAVIVKLTGVDLNLFWDISPALFFIISFSAYTLFYKKVMYNYDIKKFFPVFVFLFLFYQLYNWDPKIDIEVMPIPDQFGRNILLPVFFALFFDYGRLKKKRGYEYYLLLTLILASILFTHEYSYMVIIFIMGAYSIVSFCFSSNTEKTLKDIHLYISLMLFSLILFVLRIRNTTFSYYSSDVYSFINNGFILVGLSFLLIAFLLNKNRFVSLSRYLNSHGFRITIISVFCLLVVVAILFDQRYSAYFIRSIQKIRKYKYFFENYSFNWVILIGIRLSLLYFGIFIFRKKIKNLYIDRTTSLFFLGTTVIILFAKIPSINILAGKLVSETYARRFLYLHDIYYIFLIILCIALIKAAVEKSGKLKDAEFKRFFPQVLSIILLLIGSAFLIIPIMQRFKDETYNREYILQENNVFQYIRENIESWSVIASYKYPAMDVVAQTPNYFISSKTPHSPFVSDENRRMSDTTKIFTFIEPIEVILELLSKYDTSYILCEHSDDRMFSPSFSLEEFNNKVERYPKLFSKVYTDDIYILYKINY